MATLLWPARDIRILLVPPETSATRKVTDVQQPLTGFQLRQRRQRPTWLFLLAILALVAAGADFRPAAAQEVEFPGPVPIPGIGDVSCGARVPWDSEGRDFLMLGNDIGFVNLVRLLSGDQNFSLFSRLFLGGRVVWLGPWENADEGTQGLVAATADPDRVFFLKIQTTTPIISILHTVDLPEDPGSLVFCGPLLPGGSELAVSLPGIDQVAFLDNAAGSWSVRQILAAGDGPQALAALDLEDDGIREVISADRGVLSGSLGIFRREGAAAWQRQGQVEVAGWPALVRAWDTDDDLRDELAVTLADRAEVLFLEADGGQLTPAGQATLSLPAESLHFCRVAGGGLGLFTAVRGRGLVEFFTPGNDGWQLVESYFAGCLPAGLVSGDIDGDGRGDLACLGSLDAPTTLLYGRDGPGFWGYPALALSATPGLSALADFDADGRPDLVVVGAEQALLSLFRGQANGGLAPTPTDQPLAFLAGGPTAVEADGSPGAELALLDFYFGMLRIFDHSEEGGFQPLTERALFPLPRRLRVADLDGDGFDDLYMVRPSTSDLLVVHGDGAGNFGDDVTLDLPTGAEDLLAVALDQDGLLDLVVADGVGRVYTCLQEATGSFAVRGQVLAGLGARYLAAGDLDGDGDLDIVVANRTDESLTCLENNGSGDLVRRVGSLPLTGTPLGLHCADLNQSGLDDVLVSLGEEGELALILSLEGWTFGAGARFPAGFSTGSFRCEDFNLDGIPDVLALDQSLNLGVTLLNLDRSLVAVEASALAGACADGGLVAEVRPDRPGAWDLDLGRGEAWLPLVRAGQALRGRLDTRGAGWVLTVTAAELAQVPAPDRAWTLRLTVGAGADRESLTLELGSGCSGAGTLPGTDLLDWDRAPWPNPFNPVVRSRINLSRPAHVTATVHDLAGHRVALLLDADLAAGAHDLAWDGRARGGPAAAGLYVLKVAGPGAVLARKILLLK